MGLATLPGVRPPHVPLPRHRARVVDSNHTLLGFEFPLLLAELYKQKGECRCGLPASQTDSDACDRPLRVCIAVRTGIFLRTLADHSHFQIPVRRHWGSAHRHILLSHPLIQRRHRGSLTLVR